MFSNMDRKEFALAILGALVIPNLVLAVICYHFGMSRPLINIDYLLPIALVPLLRFRFAGLILFLLFSIVFFIDSLLIALQVFPFITLSDILYLSNFIFLGPVSFRLYLFLLVVLLFFEYFVITKIVVKIKIKTFLVIFLFLCIFQLVITLIFMAINNSLKKAELPLLIRSNALFLVKNHNANFFMLKHLTALRSTSFQTASDPWFNQITLNKPLANKLLLIVNESWGFPKDSLVQEETLKKLKANKASFSYFYQGSFDVIGATVAGELRELCQLDPQLMDLSNVNKGFENCLPNKLKAKGYQTVSLHANKTIMYERKHWYPLAGIGKSYFGNEINLPKDSFDNMGIFDPNLIPFISWQFNQYNKLFLYWMTLTTHTPYPKADIRNQRFSCQHFNIDTDSESCRNLMLQTQFFDALADLVSKPEMRGVDVIVVGDHPPPLLNFAQGIKVFDPSKVSWIHFKVKDDVDNKQQVENNENKSDSNPK